ncbi:hypothetical protein ATK17_0902 [Branchiibius hedensis]|uniref:Prenyltransferase and squalene oxidase repeat-containing protein n=1 Tax=Branchiibius hedensis TaxID=672460 RepID=A0A2Y8ZUS2_9MICO|nr:prenyltransferase/squalene oxidase repeat-containing protein [Branchiibius hedensis]PWJ24801.1 hypothetical protein ATK17_0902 [Branchiibius hedensis]SSA33617.1 hypothetical protein SAMN04489750_0902 [Branchiibius hedensis]
MHPTTAARRAGMFAIPAGVLAVTLAFGPPASAADSTEPGHPASRYLALRIADGGGRLLYDPYQGQQYDNLGGTADAMMGMIANGTSMIAVKQARDYLQKNVANYIGSGTELYAGATAKLLLAVDSSTSRVDPTPSVRNFGGVDLVARLQSLQTESGRFSDQSSYPDGDYSNGITQSLGILALSKVGIKAPTTVAYLLKQQCSDGGFDLTLDDPKGCTSDPDTTGYAVQALVAAGSDRAAVTRATNYLAAAQKSSGAVGNGQTGVANSTALAAMAFSVAGDTARWSKARSYLFSLQYPCSTPPKLRGAIAANAQIRASKIAEGAKAKPDQSDDVATGQALVAMAGANYITLDANLAVGAIPADECAATPPATSVTPPPSSSAASSTSAVSSSSAVTGPPVVTDGPETGAPGAEGVAIVLLGAVAVGAGGLSVARRGRGRHTR